MSGLLALLDDVAGIAKVAAASVDDVTAQAVKASSKASAVVIDDAAVTPKYVTGLDAARELPIIWKITKGSIFNKIVILLPVAMLLSIFAPWLITPLLMLGGAYLCFEGAEKVLHWVAPHADKKVEQDLDPKDPAHLEEERVQGAIKTDFILSAEIMTIILNEIPDGSLWFKAGSLGVAGLIITAVVYGSVALIVKMDDIGLRLSQVGRLAATRTFGRWLVKAMPKFLKLLSVVGTLAMLWVGGQIILHGLEVMHWWAAPYELFHDWAHAAAVAAGETFEGIVDWAVNALLSGLFGLAVGLLLIPVGTRIIGPLIARVTGKEAAAH